MTEKTLFFGGLPTEPDVKKIKEAYPDSELVTGKLIPYQDIAELIKQPFGTSRFRTVTNAWRKDVEKLTNKIIGVEPNIGFKVLSEPEKVVYGGQKLKMAGRAARRSYVIAARTDVLQLTDTERARLNHQTTICGKIIASAQLKNVPQLPNMREESK